MIGGTPIRILVWIAAAASLLALVALLSIPADEKNALLFGYSASRLALAAALGVPALASLWLGIRSVRDREWWDAATQRLRAWLEAKGRIGAARHLLFLSCLWGAILLRVTLGLPNASPHKAYLLRLSPHIALTTFLAIAGLILVLDFEALWAAVTRLPTTLGRALARLLRFRAGRGLILLAVNLALIVGILYAFEARLRRADPCIQLRVGLGFDSNDYTIHPLCYYGLEVHELSEGIYTWGHLVVDNSLGFREREFEIPKPAQACRVMVLGDSFTWGAGLATEERYTAVAEELLQQAFPEAGFEVLNFGLWGGSTTAERDVLAEYGELVSPDIIVTSFFHNDPEAPPDVEREAEVATDQEDAADAAETVSSLLDRLQLSLIGGKLEQASENVSVQVGSAEPWWVVFDRNYDLESAAWREFEQALQDIYQMNLDLGNPPPVFAVLTNEIMTAEKLALEKFQIIQSWQDQAEATARQIGFLAYNHDDVLPQAVSLEEVPVNALDTHPSAKVNRVFGEKLYDVLAELHRAGSLCGE